MYLPTKTISTHPRYVGSGVFGSIGKLLGRVASKATSTAAKKLAKKAVSKAGEQAGKALLKKTQAVADEKVAQLVDMTMKKMAKPKAKAVAQPVVNTQLVDMALKKMVKPKAKAVPMPAPVSQPSADEIINNLIAGSGNKTKKAPLRGSGVLKLEDIINRTMITPPFFTPVNNGFAGSGIKTL